MDRHELVISVHTQHQGVDHEEITILLLLTYWMVSLPVCLAAPSSTLPNQTLGSRPVFWASFLVLAILAGPALYEAKKKRLKSANSALSLSCPAHFWLTTP